MNKILTVISKSYEKRKKKETLISIINNNLETATYIVIYFI